MGGYLGQVGYTKDLMMTGQLGNFSSHSLGRLAADTGVNLIKDDSVNLVPPGKKTFHGQHETGKFATGDHVGQGLRRFTGVCGKQKFHRIRAGCRQR